MNLATCRVDPDSPFPSHAVPCVVLIAVSPGTVFFFIGTKVPRDQRARLTGRLHFPHRRLILAISSEAAAPPG
jgi:hypothetical protein